MRRTTALFIVAVVLVLTVMASLRVEQQATFSWKTYGTLGWGRGRTEVGLITSEDGHRFGPSDFFFDHGALEVVDYANDRLVTLLPDGKTALRRLPTATVAAAPAQGGLMSASSVTQSVTFPSGRALAFPPPGKGVRRVADLSAFGPEDLLLLVRFVPSGMESALFLVSPKGYRALRGRVRSVAVDPDGGFAWSDGEVIHAPDGTIVGHSKGELVGMDRQGRIAVVSDPGTPSQEVAFYPAGGTVSVPDDGWAVLGETVRLLPDGQLLAADATPKGVIFRVGWPTITTHIRISPLALFRGG